MKIDENTLVKLCNSRGETVWCGALGRVAVRWPELDGAAVARALARRAEPVAVMIRDEVLLLTVIAGPAAARSRWRRVPWRAVAVAAAASAAATLWWFFFQGARR